MSEPHKHQKQSNCGLMHESAGWCFNCCDCKSPAKKPARAGIEEMVAAIDNTIRERRIVKRFLELTAARDYILTASKHHCKPPLGNPTREEAMAEIAEAMTVLAPSMPESGLVDACRQVKQVAITEAGNARALEAKVEVVRRQMEREIAGLRKAIKSSIEFAEWARDVASGAEGDWWDMREHAEAFLFALRNPLNKDKDEMGIAKEPTAPVDQEIVALEDRAMSDQVRNARAKEGANGT